MWPKVLAFIMQVLPVIPNLVVDVENLFRNQANSGPQKWVAVEQVLSQHIAQTADDIAQLAPAGTKAEDISKAISLYTRAINDATVALANTLGIFPHAGQPPTAPPATPPAS
jgi:hypothetical protein